MPSRTAEAPMTCPSWPTFSCSSATFPRPPRLSEWVSPGPRNPQPRCGFVDVQQCWPSVEAIDGSRKCTAPAPTSSCPRSSTAVERAPQPPSRRYCWPSPIPGRHSSSCSTPFLRRQVIAGSTSSWCGVRAPRRTWWRLVTTRETRTYPPSDMPVWANWSHCGRRFRKPPSRPAVTPTSCSRPWAPCSKPNDAEPLETGTRPRRGARPPRPVSSPPCVGTNTSRYGGWGRRLARKRGSTAEAANALRAAHGYALEQEAEPLRRRVEESAATARISLAKPSVPTPEAAPAAFTGLTTREREVLAHLVANRTNAEIAQTLFISEKTVSVHVSNLLRKTATGSRREVAALARRVGWGIGG